MGARSMGSDGGSRGETGCAQLPRSARRVKSPDRYIVTFEPIRMTLNCPGHGGRWGEAPPPARSGHRAPAAARTVRPGFHRPPSVSVIGFSGTPVSFRSTMLIS